MDVLGQKISKKIAFQYASIVFAFVLVGQFSFADIPLHNITSQTINNIAGVIGMAVAVPPNEENTLAQALVSKEIELNEREKAIDAKEREIREVVLEETGKQNRLILLVLVGVTLLLVLLIGVNFYLDQRRGQSQFVSYESKPKVGPHAHEGEFQTKL